jgi:hypothetical protein
MFLVIEHGRNKQGLTAVPHIGIPSFELIGSHLEFCEISVEKLFAVGELGIKVNKAHRPFVHCDTLMKARGKDLIVFGFQATSFGNMRRRSYS